MTSETRSFSTPPLGVLAEINQRLAAITPEQYIAPGVARGENDQVVAMATHEIKRLCTLRILLMEDCNDIATGGLEKAERAERDARAFEAREHPAKDSPTPGFLLEHLSVLKKAKADFDRTRSLLDIVESILRLEAEQQHPDLADAAAITIYSDWSLCRNDGIEGMLGILRISGHGSAGDLSAILGLGGGR